MIQEQTLASRLLLALPGMGDPRFDHAVIALCTHNEEGAFGIGVGEVRDGVGLHALLEDLEIEPGLAPDVPVLNGGPVEPQRGFVLHSLDWTSPATLAVAPLCGLSASLEILRAIAAGQGPERWLVALGYAGWGAGQLDEEMHRHGWYAAEPHPEVLWDTAAPGRWHAAWRAEGIDPALLASQTGRA